MMRAFRMRSLGARLFAAASISIAIALLFTWLALTRLFADYVADGYQHELQAVADTIVANLGVRDGALILNGEPTDARFEIAAGGRYWQVDGPSNFRKRSRSLWDVGINAVEPLKADSSLLLADGPSGDKVLVLRQEASLERNELEYKAVVQVAADFGEYSNALSAFRSRIFGMLLLTGLFLLGAAALQIFFGLRPLINVRKAVIALRQGHVQQIDIKGPEEVRPLITEINTLVKNNQLAVTRARDRASDLAHGLKTPLTILSQVSESLSKKGDNNSARMMDQQISTIRSRVDRQLALARTGNPGKSVLDAADALNRLIKATKPLADASSINIETHSPSGLLIAADATDFLEATGNIVDNAVRHASARISLSAIKNNAAIRVTVSDDGPGIPEGERDAALERGRRLDESGDGTGLGLAISSEILRAYGGSISLGRSDMGGLSVHMDWPKKPGT